MNDNNNILLAFITNLISTVLGVVVGGFITIKTSKVSNTHLISISNQLNLIQKLKNMLINHQIKVEQESLDTCKLNNKDLIFIKKNFKEKIKELVHEIWEINNFIVNETEIIRKYYDKTDILDNDLLNFSINLCDLDKTSCLKVFNQILDRHFQKVVEIIVSLNNEEEELLKIKNL